MPLPAFKAYDIRGRVPEELNEDLARRIGKALAARLDDGPVVLGHDVRLTSPRLQEALAAGLRGEGREVIDIGLCGTEEVYFQTDYLGAAGGVNANYYAEINAEECVGCGVCADERCQVLAIGESDSVYQVIRDKCIGCGLCVSTCPSNAISLIRKNPEDIVMPPVDEDDWYRRRSRMRGVDYSKYA